jgi:hypothetical protein
MQPWREIQRVFLPAHKIEASPFSLAVLFPIIRLAEPKGYPTLPNRIRGGTMRGLLLSVVFVLMICASATAQDTATANEASTDPSFGACRPGNSIILANLCAGQTLGLKVNAADAALGSKPGEIWLYGGGAFGDENSRIIISSHHTLRIFPGTYTSTGYYGVIILNNDSSLICSDPGTTTLEEPSHVAVARGDMWNVVQASGTFYTVPGTLIPYPNKNISVKGCHFKGTRSDGSPTNRTVAMGNCHNCEVSGNIFEGMNVIATGYGYPSSMTSKDPLGLGFYAENSSIQNNLFIGQDGFAVALTNGQNIRITNNTFLRPNLGFSLFLDIEPNASTDRIVRVVVSNNIIDFEGSKSYGSGISITNNAHVPPLRYREILIENNTMNGAAASTTNLASRKMQNAVRLSLGAMDVQIRNNTIRFAVKSAIHADGTRILVQGNSIFGTNDYPIYLGSASNQSVVSANHLHCDVSLTDVCSTQIQNDGAASNVIDGNLRSGVPAVLAGSGAGTSPTVSIKGDDIQGYIDLTTGDSPRASATVLTVKFANAHGNMPVSIPLSSANSNSAALSGRGQVYVDIRKSSGKSFVIQVGAAPLAPHTGYRWFYGPVKQ